MLNRYDATELDLSFGWKHLAGALFAPLSTSQGRRARTGELLAVAIPLNACAHAAWLSFFFSWGRPLGAELRKALRGALHLLPLRSQTAYPRLLLPSGCLSFPELPNWCLWHQPGTTALYRPLERNLVEIARPDLQTPTFFHHLGALPFAQLPTGAIQHLQKD